MADTITATIILLLIGFGGGFYIRDRRAKADAAWRIAKKDHEIARLRAEADVAWKAEERRLANVAQWKRTAEAHDVSDTENQIRFISQATLLAVRPVNKEAAPVLYAIDAWIKLYQPDWRVSFEVAMGAFIKTRYDPADRKLKAAFNSYNSKRVDFLLIDRFGVPKLVVEYHGTGHDLSGDAADRMRVKRLALSRAGIPLVEIPARATKADILQAITRQLAPSRSPVTPR